MYNVVIFTDITDNIVSMPNLGPYKCAHVLRKHGYTCLVVNHLSEYTESELKDLLDQVIGNNTILVGFSSTFLRDVQIERVPGQPTPRYPEIGVKTVFPQGKEFENQIVSYIKNINENVKFVVGGVKVSLQYANKNIDYVCVGYSEISIVNLADHISKNVQLEKSFKNANGVIIIDDREAKRYDFANEDMVWLPTDIVNHKTLPIEIGRGCIFKCKFCSFPLMGKKNLDHIKNSNILYRELKYNYDNYGVTNYMLGDDTFNDHPDKLSMILDAVTKLDFQPKFWGYHRLDLLCTRPETIPILYDIGVRAMYFGIETLHPEAGRAIGKAYDRSKQIKMIEHIRSTYDDITLHGSFIIGLPGESKESILQTHKQLLNQTIPLNSWRYNGLLIAEPDSASFDSEFTKDYAKFGYENTGTLLSIWINWRNEYMDAVAAHEMANQLNAESAASDVFYLEGNMSMPLTTMGLDFNNLRKTLKRNFDYNNVEHNVRPKFISEYKQQLLNLIKKEIK
jgi:radical SAM superfamily enzyme YgiQ (UPF0313 family)